MHVIAIGGEDAIADHEQPAGRRADRLVHTEQVPGRRVPDADARAGGGHQDPAIVAQRGTLPDAGVGERL